MLQDGHRGCHRRWSGRSPRPKLSVRDQGERGRRREEEGERKEGGGVNRGEEERGDECERKGER